MRLLYFSSAYVHMYVLRFCSGTIGDNSELQYICIKHIITSWLKKFMYHSAYSKKKNDKKNGKKIQYSTFDPHTFSYLYMLRKIWATLFCNSCQGAQDSISCEFEKKKAEVWTEEIWTVQDFFDAMCLDKARENTSTRSQRRSNETKVSRKRNTTATIWKYKSSTSSTYCK